MFIRKKSFTLIEMVLVIGIMVIIMTIAIPAFSTMRAQNDVKNANLVISNLIKLARARSTNVEYIAYGVLFYIDPDGHQIATFINALPYPIADDEVWPDVINRYIIDGTNYKVTVLGNSVRVAPEQLLEWEPEDLFNFDYRTGKQRNFFAIIFYRGVRMRPDPFILYDPDKDDDDFGDITGLPVSDTFGTFGGALRDIVSDESNKRREITTDWGFLIYDENLFQQFGPNNLDLLTFLPYHLTRNGNVIALEEGK